MIDLDPPSRALLARLLAFYLPPHRAFVFGSRVQGRSRRFSDVDVAIQADGPLPPDVMGQTREAISASDLPYLVDLVDLQRARPEVRERILADMEPLVP